MSQPPPSDGDRQSGEDQPSGNQWPSGNKWPSGNQWPTGNQWPSGDQRPSGNQPPSWPSSGQQAWPSGSSGSSDSFGQDQPPSWPPEEQSPYPSPGYAYGYGPRPPRSRRRHQVRGALITLGLLIAFGVVVGQVTGHHGTGSATSAGPSVSVGLFTPSQAPPGPVGSHFNLRDGNGNTYQVTLVKVIDPATGAGQFGTPDSGKRFVGAVFRVKAVKGSPQNEDANDDAVLVGGNGKNYSADFSAIAGYTNFDNGEIRVSQGGTVTGAVTFQVPNGVSVSKVQWGALSGFGAIVEWDVNS